MSTTLPAASAPGAPAAGAAGGLDRETRVAAVVVIAGVIMSILDATIVNVALDALARDLRTSLGTIQWVATGYLLSLAVVIPLSGWTSERFGARKVWIATVTLFALGSALCGLAWSAGSLIAFRVLQGLGGGMILPVGMSLLAQAAGPQRLGRVMSVFGVPMLLGPVLGPALGGLIVDHASWRWIFYVNIPISVVAVTLAVRLLPHTAGRVDAGRFDWAGAALLPPGLAAIVFGLSETASRGGMGRPVAWAPVAAGLLLVGLFVAHARRAPRPLIDVRLFRSRRFGAAALTAWLLGGALFGAMIVLPLYFQVARGQSALTAGLLIAPQGLGAALAMPFTGRLADRHGGGAVALAGCLIMTLATVPLALAGDGTSYAAISGMLLLRGVGLGASMMPAMAAAYAALTPPEVPRATSALNALQRLGGSMGGTLLAVVLQHQTRAAQSLATAFGHTFAWAAGMTLVATVPAAALALAERAAR